MIGAEDVLKAISNTNRGVAGRNRNTSVRPANSSPPAAAHQSPRRSAIRLALACAAAIAPHIALADSIFRQSPTVIVDTTIAPTGHAFFVEAKGIYEDFFSGQGWFNPVVGGYHGNGTGVDPSQWSDNAVWVPWTDPPRAGHMNGFFNFVDANNNLVLGAPWIVPTNNSFMPWQFNWKTMTPPDNAGFVVESGFAWNESGTGTLLGPGRLNFFGMTLPAFDAVPHGGVSANNVIRELWWDGGQWNWNDHGRPPGTDTVILGRGVVECSARCRKAEEGRRPRRAETIQVYLSLSFG
jgi:hypothetical protein